MDGRGETASYLPTLSAGQYAGHLPHKSADSDNRLGSIEPKSSARSVEIVVIAFRPTYRGIATVLLTEYRRPDRGGGHGLHPDGAGAAASVGALPHGRGRLRRG